MYRHPASRVRLLRFRLEFTFTVKGLKRIKGKEEIQEDEGSEDLQRTNVETKRNYYFSKGDFQVKKYTEDIHYYHPRPSITPLLLSEGLTHCLPGRITCDEDTLNNRVFLLRKNHRE